MAAAASGDRVAFDDLVRRYRGRVYRIARVISGEDAMAEDILQETFLAALRGAPTFRGDSFRAWLYTIARHEASRMCRRPRPIPTEAATLEALGQAAGWGEPSADHTLSDARDLVFQALAASPEDDRTILVLRDVEGLSGPETAHALGLGLAAMKSRLHRARLRLAVEVRRLGDDDA